MEKGKAKHYDEGKPRFDLLPPQVLFDIAEVFTWGTKKYGDRNWEMGMVWGKVFGSIMRHLWKFWSPFHKDYDEESGLHHLAHAGACIFMLFGLTITHPELDDRPEGKNGNKKKT